MCWARRASSPGRSKSTPGAACSTSTARPWMRLRCGSRHCRSCCPASSTCTCTAARAATSWTAATPPTQVAACHARHGTTSLLATTMTAPFADLETAFAALRAALRQRGRRARRACWACTSRAPTSTPASSARSPTSRGPSTPASCAHCTRSRRSGSSRWRPRLPGHLERMRGWSQARPCRADRPHARQLRGRRAALAPAPAASRTCSTP